MESRSASVGGDRRERFGCVDSRIRDDVRSGVGVRGEGPAVRRRA